MSYKLREESLVLVNLTNWILIVCIIIVYKDFSRQIAKDISCEANYVKSGIFSSMSIIVWFFVDLVYHIEEFFNEDLVCN